VRAQGTPAFAHAKQQFEARNYDAARGEFLAMRRTSPADALPYLYLGRIALAQNNNDEAVRQFEQCTSVDDRNAECHLWLGSALGLAAPHTNKLKLPFLAKRTKKEFDRAVELDPNSVDARFGLLQYYMYAPGFLGGSADKAREQADEIEKRSRLRGALAYGQLADHDKNAGEAEAAFQRAIVVAPDSAAGYHALAGFLTREKRWGDAFAIYDRLVARVPADTNALLSIARLAGTSGEQLARGEEAAKRWLANPPHDANVQQQAVAHYRLGMIYERSARRELARSEYERATALNPRNEEARKALEGLKLTTG
jgi:tetratricopeptide (TPR) repeat protein